MEQLQDPDAAGDRTTLLTNELEVVEDRKAVAKSERGNLYMALLYVWSDLKKNPRSFIVGCIAVTVVVFSISLLEATIVSAPVLFLKLAENTVGEYDVGIVLAPARTEDSSSFALNHTRVSEATTELNPYRGVAPRWVLLGNILNAMNPLLNSTSVLLVIDSDKEKELGLGREWPHKSLQGYRTHVTGALLRLLHLKSQDNLTVLIDPLSLMHTVSGDSSSMQDWIRARFRQLFSTLLNNASTSVNPFADLDADIDRIGELLNLSPSDIAFLHLLARTLASRPEAAGIAYSAIIQAANIFLHNLGLDIDINQIDDDDYLTNDRIAAIQRALSFSFNLTVEDSIRDPKGKYPLSLGNVVVLEAELFQVIMQEFIVSFVDKFQVSAESAARSLLPENEAHMIIDYVANATSFLKESIEKLKIREYSLLLVGIFRDRVDAFVKTKEGLEADVIDWTNQLVNKLGLNYPFSIQVPLVQGLRILYYLRLFLDQILLIIEVFLIGLGMALIYALLIADVDAKVYECGMLRALGMAQFTLIELLSIQSLFFSAPALVLGLLLAWAAHTPVAYLLGSYSAVSLSSFLSVRAVLMGTVVGFTMPFISLIGPIQRSLSNTLRDALNLYHNPNNNTIVTFVTLENLGFSLTESLMAVLAVSFGVITYYGIPSAFIFFRWALAFSLFAVILIGMIIGVALLGMILQPFLQLLVVHLTIWGPDRTRLKPLVLKNLYGHSRRNSNTTILFTICIAFIIFSGAEFSNQAYAIVSSTKIGIGADVVIQSFINALSLDHVNMASWLDTYMKRNDSIVLSYTFSSFPLAALEMVGRTTIGNLADFPTFKVYLIGLDNNFFDSTYDEFLEVTEATSGISYPKTRHGKADIVRSLYTHPSPAAEVVDQSEIFSGTINATDRIQLPNEVSYSHPLDLIISEALRLSASVDTTTPMEVVLTVPSKKFEQWRQYDSIHFLAQPRALVSNFPGFVFSSYSQTSALTEVLISMEHLDRLVGILYNVSKDYLAPSERPPKTMPRRALYLRIKESASIEDREDIINELRNFIRVSVSQSQDDRMVILNTKDVLQFTETLDLVINLFFLVIASIIIFICFFLLYVSFTTNVNENAWEFGVLRALGMSYWQVIRVYVYEAVSIIISSVLLGLGVGLIVSITLIIQTTVFTELPFTFFFPTLLFCSITAMSFVVAFVASFLPARALLAKKISSVLKNSSS